MKKSSVRIQLAAAALATLVFTSYQSWAAGGAPAGCATDASAWLGGCGQQNQAPVAQQNNNNSNGKSGLDTDQSSMPIAVQGQQVLNISSSGLNLTQGIVNAAQGASLGQSSASCGSGQGAGVIQFSGGQFYGCDGSGWKVLQQTVNVVVQQTSCLFFC